MNKTINREKAIELAKEVFQSDNLAEAEKISGNELWDKAKKGQAKWNEAYMAWYRFYKVRGDFLKSIEDRFEIFVPDRRVFQIKASDKKHHWYSFHCDTNDLYLYPDFNSGISHKDAPVNKNSNVVEWIEFD